MIALLISLVLTFALFACAYLGTKHPLVSVGRAVSAGCSLTACIALITGLALYPMTQVWQAERAADVQLERLNAEAARTKIMIEQLGSASAYIEYLKAIKAE